MAKKKVRRKKTSKKPLRPHKGVLVLVLGVLSLTTCWVFAAVPGVLIGSRQLSLMRKGVVAPAGHDITNGSLVPPA